MTKEGEAITKALVLAARQKGWLRKRKELHAKNICKAKLLSARHDEDEKAAREQMGSAKRAAVDVFEARTKAADEAYADGLAVLGDEEAAADRAYEMAKAEVDDHRESSFKALNIDIDAVMAGE